MAGPPGGDDPLQLNSLKRFSKSSDRLVLEEYDHCEVPAGCGGMIFRWRDPAAGVPVAVRIATAAEVSAALDGRSVDDGEANLKAGWHVLAVHLSGADRPPNLLIAALTLNLPEHQLRAAGESPWFVGSAPNGYWRCSSLDPGEGWEGLDFKERSFHPMAASPVALGQLKGDKSWRYQRLERLGAKALDLPRGHQELWVRARFFLKEEQVARWGVHAG